MSFAAFELWTRSPFGVIRAMMSDGRIILILVNHGRSLSHLSEQLFHWCTCFDWSIVIPIVRVQLLLLSDYSCFNRPSSCFNCPTNCFIRSSSCFNWPTSCSNWLSSCFNCSTIVISIARAVASTVRSVVSDQWFQWTDHAVASTGRL